MRGAIAVAGFLAAALCAGDLGCARSAGDAAFNGDEIYGACAAPLVAASTRLAETAAMSFCMLFLPQRNCFGVVAAKPF